MDKFIPFDKLSKRRQRELNRERRRDWGALNPVTRRAVNPKAYDRNKARKRSDDSSDFGLSLCGFHDNPTVCRPCTPRIRAIAPTRASRRACSC
jgi:hypothetical protein